MATFERELKVSKTDAYELDVNDWANGEAIISLVVTNPDAFVIVGANAIDGSSLSVLLTGVTVGNAEVHFEYSTATRTDCYKATVKVVDDC